MQESPDHRRRGTDPFDYSVRVLERGLRIFLGILALVIMAGAVFLMLKMDGGSQSQGGRFYVALAALVALGAVDAQFSRLVRRRMPFSVTTTSQERRYSGVSLLLLLVSAVVLIGLAWLLP